MNTIKAQTKSWQPYLWLFIAAGSLLLSTGRFSIGIFAWISVIFSLMFTRQTKAIPGYLLISLASFIALSIGWYGLQPLPLPFLLVSMLVGSLIGNLPLLIDRIFFVHRPTFLNTLTFPFLATALEYFSLNGSPLGSFGAMAYSQTNNLLLMQTVSLVGIWGLAFIINWTGSVLSWAWINHFETKKMRPAVSLMVILLIVFLFGAVRLTFAKNQENNLRVAGIIAQPIRDQFPVLMPLSLSDRPAFEEETKAITLVNFQAAETAMNEKPDMILFQEGAFLTTMESKNDLIQQAQSFSQEHQVYMIVPMMVLPDTTEEKAINQVYILTPQGEIGLNHIKFGGNQIEGTLPGDGTLQTLTTPFGTISSVICWDMDFPEQILQAGRNGTQILFSPANEWKEINPLHAQMAKSRGIENGVFNVHLAEGGLSMVSDPYGRILSTWENDKIKIVDMPVFNIPTLYSKTGDVFPFISFILGFVLIGANLILNIKNRKHKK